jgi:hypothetical protein
LQALLASGQKKAKDSNAAKLMHMKSESPIKAMVDPSATEISPPPRSQGTLVGMAFFLFFGVYVGIDTHLQTI